jgi:hypothetical protein
MQYNTMVSTTRRLNTLKQTFKKTITTIFISDEIATDQIPFPSCPPQQAIELLSEMDHIRHVVSSDMEIALSSCHIWQSQIRDPCPKRMIGSDLTF